METQAEGERHALLPGAEKHPVGNPSPLGEYLGYLKPARDRISRHARQLTSALSRSLRYVWATARLGTDFITYIAVSFFFTLGMYVYFFLYNLYLLDLGLK